MAARLIYYPFINSEYKTESLFEYALIDVLKTEKILNFSINEQLVSENV